MGGSAPIVVEGSRWRGARVAAGVAIGAASTAGVVAALPALQELLPIWLALAALAAGVGAWAATAPARLELSAAGIAERGPWRTRRWLWGEVYDFRPALVGLASRTVGFSFTPARRRSALGRWLARLTPVDGVLSPGWELDPATLAAALNVARDRWLAGDGRLARHDVTPGFVGARTGLYGYWPAVAALAAATALLAEVGWPLAAAALTPLWARLYAGRLHDLGRSGWWQLAGWGIGGALLAGLVAAAQPPTTIANVALAAWAAITLALGAFPGQSGANRFGPAPGEASPLALAEAFR